MRKPLSFTFHVSRITPVVASLNVVLMISILILIRILFTKQNLQKPRLGMLNYHKSLPSLPTSYGVMLCLNPWNKPSLFYVILGKTL